jgi:hypothetical protein
MKLQKAMKLALRNILRNKLRNSFVILAVNFEEYL